ncbi:MAG: heavy metal-associated domain-containing protein [Solidesulfovibrio sp.]|uniref:heavy-metal-associated domain-containing protein n=1 Tax=Solidesulfovibrio sp. TaxID=2910990 RepID=UPI002B203DD2|nr:heavy metal-associated domain-containing protein [Solidesulfovibrio sp.]MEA4855771.1 heavy metal-associated domain-containing protein [Solidesulfovibrio sp.]
MTTMKVEGMHCPKCVASVTKALSEVPGLSNVSVNLEKGEATFDGDAPHDALKAAVDRIGFIPGAIE